MAKAHATLSASGSDKWLSCAGALALEAIINEPDIGDEFSHGGLAAHWVLSESLINGNEPSEYLGKLTTVDVGQPGEAVIKIDQEMINAVDICIDYVKRLTVKPGYYEERVDYSHIAPQGFGTTDIALEVYDKIGIDVWQNTLYIIDFKYGLGVKVAAYMNSQLLLYALGCLNSLELLFERDIERIVIVVMQPRRDNIDEYEISLADLIAWGESIKPKANLANELYLEAINEGTTPDIKHFNPTKKGCLWCQGRTLKRCKAHAQTGYKAALEGFEDLTVEQQSDLPAIEVSGSTIKDPAFLDNEDLAAIYTNMKMFTSFAEDLDVEIANRITSGELIPGLRLISTEKSRTWKGDDDEAVKHMRTAGLQKTEYLKTTIITPTQAEAALKEVKPKDYKRRYKKLAASAIHRPPGEPKLIIDKSKPVEDEDDLLG